MTILTLLMTCTLGLAHQEGAALDELPLVQVGPTIAGKNQVRWWELDWQWTEFEPVTGAAPVRMYFYQDLIAPRAKAFTVEAYRDAAELFEYLPTRHAPYLIYNSHFEFQSTTAFLVSERVLGVTDIAELLTALPYWGDHARFEHILRHELAHQFTIQKVVDASREAGVPNPLPAMPLWYIEGVAEFFAHDDLTPEVRAVLADRLISEDLDLPSFFDVPPLDFERVYLIGHAQVRFLEEEFGEGTNALIHRESYRLTRPRSLTPWRVRRPPTFPELLSDLTGVAPAEIDERWREWVEEELHPAFEVEAPLSVIEDLGVGRIDSLSLAPDGRTIFYRTFDERTGRSRLFLQDLADPTSRVEVDRDDRLGRDRLHGLDRRVSAAGEEMLVWIGRVGATDHLFARPYTREVRGDRVRYRFGRTRGHSLARHFEIIEAGYPAVSPVDQSVSFTALSRSTAAIDVYRMDDPLGRGQVTQVTDRPHVMRDLAYLADGTLVLSSDATPGGNFELFSLDPEGELAPLTLFEVPANVRHPSPDRDGGVVFSADETGFTQAYRLSNGELTRLTQLPTRLEHPVVTAGEELLGISTIAGEASLVVLDRDEWLDEPAMAKVRVPFEAREIPAITPEDVMPYRPFDPRNYGLRDISLFLAGGEYAAGRVVFDDLFRARQVGLSIRYIGGPDLFDAALSYVNRAGRVTFGGGLFVDSAIQVDPLVPEALETFRVQRTGATAALLYPFTRRTRVEAFLTPHALRADRFTEGAADLEQRVGGTWFALEGGGRFALDTLRSIMPVGPFSGASTVLEARGTVIPGDPGSFARLGLESQLYRPVTFRLPRLYLYGRLAGGSTIGGDLGSQYFLPSAYNHRGLPADEFLELIGQHYWLATGEVRLPLDLLLPILPFIEVVGGLDAGAVTFDIDRLFQDRIAAAVVGMNLGLAPGFSIRLHLARPLDIGGAQPEDRWLWHLSLFSPFFVF